MNRTFLVGCPRSGTTLLQSILASHSRIVSFPETHLLSLTIPIHSIGQTLSVYGAGSRRTLREKLVQLGMEEEEIIVPQKTIYRTSCWVLILLRNIDKLAEQQGNSSTERWIEKTPRHLHYAGLLADIAPSIKFIHMMRRGQHVVPSLYFATQKNPEEWDGARSLKKCVFWWNRSVELSLKYLGAPNHMHVSYQQVAEQSERVAQAVCRFLELDFEPRMLDKFHKTAESLIEDSEEWKQKNRTSEIDASSKLSRLSKEQQAYVKNHIVDFPFDRIRV